MSSQLPKPTLAWLFFSFRGRIARQAYALSALFMLVLLGLAVYQSVQGSSRVEAGGPDAQLIFAGLLIMAVMTFSFWSMLALSVKRLQDLNHPGMLVLLLFFPGINTFTVLYLMLRPSHPEANEHGPVPQLRNPNL